MTVSDEKTARDIGEAIYELALADRRGFRDDQLGIFDDEIWNEIYTDIGQRALTAVAPMIRRMALEEAAIAMDDWPCRAATIRAMALNPDVSAPAQGAET